MAESRSSKSNQQDNSIPFVDLLHSGHLYYLLKRANRGLVPARKDLMRFFCEVVERGGQPRPAIHAFLVEAIRKVLDGENAAKAFGQMRDRAGKPPLWQQGDFPRVSVNEEDRRKLMRLMPSYRDWEIARQVKDLLDAGHSLKDARAMVANDVGVSESTVHRAWKKGIEPNPILAEWFCSVQAAADEYQQFVDQCRAQMSPNDIAEQWRNKAFTCFRNFGREAARDMPEVSAECAWYKKVTSDRSYAYALFLYSDLRNIEGVDARVPEEELRAAFIEAFNEERQDSATRSV